MKKAVCGVVAAGILAAAGGASAQEKLLRLYADVKLPRAEGRAEVARVRAKCGFSRMSRVGPSLEEVEGCLSARQALAKHGVAAAGAIFAALDDPTTHDGPRDELYGILAEMDDARLVDPLIAAAARLAAHHADDRSFEADSIERALRHLTGAPVGMTAPWQPPPARSPSAQGLDRVVDWRLWQRDKAGKTAEELRRGELDRARALAEGADPVDAYVAVRLLLERDHRAGLLAAKRLVTRDDVPEAGKREIVDQARWSHPGGARGLRTLDELIAALDAAPAPAPKPRPKAPPPPDPAAPAAVPQPPPAPPDTAVPRS